MPKTFEYTMLSYKQTHHPQNFNVWNSDDMHADHGYPRQLCCIQQSKDVWTNEK